MHYLFYLELFTISCTVLVMTLLLWVYNKLQYDYHHRTNDHFRSHKEKKQYEKQLRKALTCMQFVIYYQPKINLKTGKISGAESLIRWQHPTKGLIMPGDFMKFIEDSELIIPLSEWIIQEVFTTIKNSAFDLPIAINLSAEHFKKNHHLTDYLTKLLSDYKINPNLIELEITENVLLKKTAESIKIISELKNMGFQLTIDDFGTKFSSFNYLKDINADKIKIDKSFVDQIPHDTDRALLLSAILALFHTLGKKVVVEGVETIKQVEFLINESCDEVQGYYFSAPLTAHDLSKLIHGGKEWKL